MSIGGVAAPLLVVTALLVGTFGLVALRSSPRLVLGVWLASICLVPVWVVVPAGPFTLEAQPAVALGCLIALLPLGNRVRDALTLPDAVMAALVVAGLLGVVVGSWSLDAVYRLVAYWVPAYLLGRLVWRRVDLLVVYRAIAIAFTVVAVLALVEFATGTNVFIGIPGSGSLRSLWAVIQVRGGAARAEGAFGHSIALGGCLATAVPITLAARLRPWVTVVAVGLMAGAAAVTLSRIGMVTLGAGLVLTLVFLPTGLSARLRAAMTVAVALLAAAVLPYVARVYGEAGDEATNSAAYRGDLISLLGDAPWLGQSGSAYRAPDGRLWFGTFRSIDNAFLLLALSTGLLTLLCVLVALAMAGAAVVTRRATAPTIALVAQIPAFATVALITQYSTWIWFLAGLAVASQVAARRDRRDAAPPTPADPARFTRRGDTGQAPLTPDPAPVDDSTVTVTREGAR